MRSAGRGSKELELKIQEIKQLLDNMDITEALWWFIENIDLDDDMRTRIFFYLRERMRNYKAVQ